MAKIREIAKINPIKVAKLHKTNKRFAYNQTSFMEFCHFNRINFRDIKFHVLASFCHFREIKTRENVEIDRWLAKSKLREILNIALFWVEKPVKTLYCCTQ